MPSVPREVGIATADRCTRDKACSDAAAEVRTEKDGEVVGDVQMLSGR
jgi:hypothetical protein